MKSQPETPLLTADEPAAATLSNPEAGSPFIVLCDHASNRIPAKLAHLGLDAKQLHSHIAWDAGALAVAEVLSRRLDATLVQSNYSRLVIDCNRSVSNKESILAVSDGVVIPGNLQIDQNERTVRQREIFHPYHQSIDSLLAQRANQNPLLLSIHSFNPEIQGRHRPWEIGVCYAEDRRLADMFLEKLPEYTSAHIGDNEPFDIDPAIDYTLPQHANKRGLRHVMLELRRDCIETPQQLAAWAGYIASACLDIERRLSK